MVYSVWYLVYGIWYAWEAGFLHRGAQLGSLSMDPRVLGGSRDVVPTYKWACNPTYNWGILSRGLYRGLCA